MRIAVTVEQKRRAHESRVKGGVLKAKRKNAFKSWLKNRGKAK